MSRTITLQMLEEAEACPDQVVLFKRLFGDSTPVTEELCVKYSHDFDFDFAADRFLTDPARDEYGKAKDVARDEYGKTEETAWDEYEKVKDAALAEYEKTRAAVLNEYKKATDAAWDEYKKVRAAVWDEYKKTRDAALNEYRKAKALTFCRLYNSEKE